MNKQAFNSCVDSAEFIRKEILDIFLPKGQPITAENARAAADLVMSSAAGIQTKDRGDERLREFHALILDLEITIENDAPEIAKELEVFADNLYTDIRFVTRVREVQANYAIINGSQILPSQIPALNIITY